MRKTQDDVMAREQAEQLLTDALLDVAEGVYGDAERAVRDVKSIVTGLFPAVEFETVTKKIGQGEEICLRRIVLTGAWAVDPNGSRK